MLEGKEALQEVPKIQRFAYRPELETVLSLKRQGDKEERNRVIRHAHFKYGYTLKKIANTWVFTTLQSVKSSIAISYRKTNISRPDPIYCSTYLYHNFVILNKEISNLSFIWKCLFYDLSGLLFYFLRCLLSGLLRITYSQGTRSSKKGSNHRSTRSNRFYPNNKIIKRERI